MSGRSQSMRRTFSSLRTAGPPVCPRTVRQISKHALTCPPRSWHGRRRGGCLQRLCETLLGSWRRLSRRFMVRAFLPIHLTSLQRHVLRRPGCTHTRAAVRDASAGQGEFTEVVPDHFGTDLDPTKGWPLCTAMRLPTNSGRMTMSRRCVRTVRRTSGGCGRGDARSPQKAARDGSAGTGREQLDDRHAVGFLRGPERHFLQVGHGVATVRELLLGARRGRCRRLRALRRDALGVMNDFFFFAMLTHLALTCRDLDPCGVGRSDRPWHQERCHGRRSWGRERLGGFHHRGGGPRGSSQHR
ncbi:MAG: hypothetical protein CM15mP79_1860 [Methanobacteriota archaeon]|nr:MAG: hypothetical protein CM15mP79_1860 [Euryarchaeota archaeon]